MGTVGVATHEGYTAAELHQHTFGARYLCRWRRDGRLCMQDQVQAICDVCAGSGGPVPRPSIELTRWHRGLDHTTDPGYPTAGERRCWGCGGRGVRQMPWCQDHLAVWRELLSPDREYLALRARMEEHYAHRLGGPPAWRARKTLAKGKLKQY